MVYKMSCETFDYLKFDINFKFCIWTVKWLVTKIIFRENIQLVHCIFFCPLILLGLQGQQSPATSGNFAGEIPRHDHVRSLT